MRILLIIAYMVLFSASISFCSDDGTPALEQLAESRQFRDPREGVATYYASRFIGRRTTSGERYNPEKMTAAHATLPLGTYVRVQRPGIEGDVVVKINDRCHPRHARRNLIDLSRAAAKRIGLWGKGIVKVRITPLDEGAEAVDQMLRGLLE